MSRNQSNGETSSSAQELAKEAIVICNEMCVKECTPSPEREYATVARRHFMIDELPSGALARYTERDSNGVTAQIDFSEKAKIESKKAKQESQNEFEDSIQLLLINSVDWRLICNFLGLNKVSGVKNCSISKVTLIGYLLMESLVDFMESKDYTFVGEVNFNNNGDVISVTKNTWFIGGKEIVFTTGGFIFFEHNSKDKSKNVVFYNATRDGNSGICCYSCDNLFSKNIIKDLDECAKKNNKLRGAKIRDVNVLEASFIEVDNIENSNWDRYYYEDNVKNLIELEVFGFLNNTEEYNKLGINKRGVMIYGPPGTGKTSIGKVICNNSKKNTVIWITPDSIAENNAGKYSIKLLYTLAEYVSPSVVILEDIDLFAVDRDSGGDTLRLGSLMNILDGINSISNSVTIAMTNRIDAVESALRNRPGRFDRLLEIPAMNEDLRRRMLTARLERFSYNEELMKFIISKTSDWTGAEIQELVNSINMYFVHNNIVGNELNKEIIDFVLSTMKKFIIKESKGQVGFGFNK